MVNSAVEIIFQQLCELCKNTIVTGNDLGCLQVFSSDGLLEIPFSHVSQLCLTAF
jgi:hypothetical protein